MEQNTNDRRPLVTLPGACARVRLPQPPNFLSGQRGESIGIGELSPGDAARLAVATAWGILSRWRDRFATSQRMAKAEAEMIDAPPLDDEMAGTVARRVAAAEGYAWLELSEESRRRRIELAHVYARAILTLPESLEDLSHATR